MTKRTAAEMDWDNFVLPDLKPFGSKYEERIKSFFENRQPLNFLSRCEEIAKKYTLLPSIWFYWYTREKESKGMFGYTIKSLDHKSFSIVEYDMQVQSEYYMIPAYNDTKNIYMDYTDFQLSKILTMKYQAMDMNFIEERLGYPHIGMEKLFNAYMKNGLTSTGPVKVTVIKKYKNALNLLEMLKIIEKNEELWIKYLKETENSEFIINSCEYHLGKNPESQEFWKCYLQYLKECGNIEMLLKTYSRYCRLFLNDYQMREKYYKQICESKLKNRINWWSDFISMNYDLKFFDANYCIGKMNEIMRKEYGISEGWDEPKGIYTQSYANFLFVIKDKEPFVLTAKKNDNSAITPLPTTLAPASRQYFSLPKHTIEKMAQNVPPKLLLKLQMLCKYFWYKNDAIYCHRFVVGVYDKPVFIENSFITNPIKVRDAKLQKWIIGNALEVSVGRFQHTQNIRTDEALSYVLGKIDCTKIRYFVAADQCLTFQEFKVLTASETFEHVDLKYVGIKNGEEYSKVEEIIALLPNVTYFLFYPLNLFNQIHYTPETAQNLTAINRKKKFSFFSLSRMTADIDPDQFATFIIKNAAKDAEFRLIFDQNTGLEIKQNFDTVIQNTVYANGAFENGKLKIFYEAI